MNGVHHPCWRDGGLFPSTFVGENPTSEPKPHAEAATTQARSFARNIDVYASELELRNAVAGAWVPAEALLIDGLRALPGIRSWEQNV